MLLQKSFWQHLTNSLSSFIFDFRQINGFGAGIKTSRWIQLNMDEERHRSQSKERRQEAGENSFHHHYKTSSTQEKEEKET